MFVDNREPYSGSRIQYLIAKAKADISMCESEIRDIQRTKGSQERITYLKGQIDMLKRNIKEMQRHPERWE